MFFELDKCFLTNIFHAFCNLLILKHDKKAYEDRYLTVTSARFQRDLTDSPPLGGVSVDNQWRRKSEPSNNLSVRNDWKCCVL